VTRIEAIIRPERLDAAKRALAKAGYHGLTVLEVSGHGRQGGVTQVWRGGKYQLDLLPKVMLLLVVPDAKARRVADSIAKAARTGKIGDGKIFLSRVHDAMRVRTGERGEKAL
jgi:nitrogen regulatory protein P-II 1